MNSDAESRLDPMSPASGDGATAVSKGRGGGPDGGQRLADRVAGQIKQDVIDGGWPIGEVLGSEGELISRYGISRAVFREAVRIVEHYGVARMRRGPGGGLVVTEPDPASIQTAAGIYLQYAGVDRRQLFEARKALELACVTAATEQITEDGIAPLREALAAEQAPHTGPGHNRRLHSVVAELTGNPVMVLFVEVLARLDEELVTRRWEKSPAEGMGTEEAASSSHQAHAAIVEAITEGDAPLAQHRMRRHLEAIAVLID